MKQLVTIFHLLNKDNKLKLPKFCHPDEVNGQLTPTIVPSIGWFPILPTNTISSGQDSSICGCWCSDIKIRAEESHYQHGALNFGTFSKVIVLDELTFVLKARLKVINPLAKKQEGIGLVPLATKSGEIMWVTPGFC